MQKVRKKMAKKKRVTLDRELREHLEQSLKDRGLDKPAFMDRINDYIFFTDRLEEMKQDMLVNGLTEYDHYGNLTTRRVVGESLKVSREIGKIYQELGLDIEARKKITQAPPPEDDIL